MVYFFDAGNEYVRIVDLSGSVSTLELGACKKCTELYIKWVREWWQVIVWRRSYAMRTG